ncbi:hypothetical protein ACKKBG_A18325 [Auxenochlorella protothecoides x Auxenochlorella symbiontica]
MGNEQTKQRKLSRMGSKLGSQNTSRKHTRVPSNPESLLSQVSENLAKEASQVLHVHLNDASTHLALKRTSSGHIQLRLPDDLKDDEEAAMTEQEVQDLKLLEDIGLGLEFSPGDAFIGQLVLDVQEASGLKPSVTNTYVTVADESDKSEAKFCSTCEDTHAWWSEARFHFIVLFSNSVLTLTLKGRSTVLGGGKTVLGRAYLPVAWLRQGSQDFELELEGSRPGKSGGRLKVHARYAWLRGTSDDGTYTKVNRLVLHRTSRVVRSAAMTAAVEHLSQVNHSLLSHDNIWAVLGPGPGAGGDEGTPAPRETASSSPTPALETQASDAESLSGAQAALAASLPALPPASLAARLASELTHAGDEGPSSTSQHAATALLDGLSGAAADTPEVADLKRSLLMVLCPVLERLEGLERKTQALTAALQERMWELGGLAEVGEGELVAQATPAAGGGDGDDDAVQRSSNSLGRLKARAANPVEPFLSGKFEYGMGRPAKRRTVFMFMRKGHWAEHPVMAPAFLGTHRTSGGGRLGPLPVTQSVASTPGHYEFVGLLPDDYSYAKGSMFMLEPGTRAVVFDLDGTITVGDGQVVTQFTLDALGASTALNAKLSHKYDLRPRRHALHAVRAWAAKGYQPIYLSGRQGSYYNLTLAWLIKHRYPPGPIHLTRTHLPTLPVYFSVGLFKVKYIEGLRAKGIDVYAAYGNTMTDIKAYEAAGIAKVGKAWGAMPGQNCVSRGYAGGSGTTSPQPGSSRWNDWPTMCPQHCTVPAPRRRDTHRDTHMRTVLQSLTPAPLHLLLFYACRRGPTSSGPLRGRTARRRLQTGPTTCPRSWHTPTQRSPSPTPNCSSLRCRDMSRTKRWWTRRARPTTSASSAPCISARRARRRSWKTASSLHPASPPSLERDRTRPAASWTTLRTMTMPQWPPRQWPWAM